MSKKQFFPLRSKCKPMIYAYKDHVLEHEGLLKVGYTEIDIDKRVAQQFPTKGPSNKKPYDIVVRESAMYPDGRSFSDHDVHKVLENKGFKRLNNSEWFRCTAEDVKAAIIAVKTNTVNVENRINTFKMRPEQEMAVNMTQNYFEKEFKNKPGYAPKFLWNAKMRFGKTFASYQLAKRMRMKKILILTFKPAVEASWEEDLLTHIDFEGWQFFSREVSINKGITPNDLDQNRPIVCFGSFQDFLGTNSLGGIKAKNEWVHTINWDMVIFDEYHYGAWRDNAKKLFDTQDEDVYENLNIEKYKKDEADNAYNESFLPITSSYYLYLSGTPFRALNSGEFIEDQVYNWTYSDEQKAKEEWNREEPNPYLSLPRMVLMTYKIPDAIKQIAYNEQFNEFDLNVFFSAKSETGNVKDAQFIYKDYVQKWLDLIRGAYLPTSIDELKLGKNKKPVLPYSDSRMLSVLTHTFWFLPNVASCYAMKNLLDEKQNNFYHQYTINVCAGNSAGIGLDALKPVKESMDDPLRTKTITLSCGKLTTGVTVRPWTGIFMLRNLSSPETYFQAAFRVQSPWEIIKEDGSKEIMKKECYIFDFSLDRALKQVTDYSCRLNITESNPEKKVEEFINFLPILAYDGSTMKSINAADVLDIAMSGTSATLLARRWESALLVNVDNETLLRLMSNQKAMDALMKIEGFRTLNKDIETIISKSDIVKKAKKDSNLDSKKKKELNKEEKEYKSKRKKIQEKLIKFATRIPIFMYLTDYREYCLKDIITQFEPELFKKVTGLSIEDFELLVSLGVFNDSLMNEAIYKFKRYEDSSLEYTGINKHSDNEDVGLFSTVITHEDYQNMQKQQLDSMKNNKENNLVADISNNKYSYKNEKVKKIKHDSHLNINKELNVTIENQDENDFSDIIKDSIVEHKKFGKGKVVNIIDGKIIVKFAQGEKMFLFPGAFKDKWLKKVSKYEEKESLANA